jgi:hypothetical protein
MGDEQRQLVCSGGGGREGLIVAAGAGGRIVGRGCPFLSLSLFLLIYTYI